MNDPSATILTTVARCRVRMQLVAAKRQIVARAMARLGGLVLRLRGNS